MKATEALAGVTRALIDTAPLIYYIQRHARYFELCRIIFDRVDTGTLKAVTTPVTLAECLVMPYRDRSRELQEQFRNLIVFGMNTQFVPIDWRIADQAAQIRAVHAVELADAYQIAAAVVSGCDAFVTNDTRLKRIAGLPVIVLDDLEPG